MVIKTIKSGDKELDDCVYQDELLSRAVRDLHNFNKPITLTLDSGQRITISKVREGADFSTRLLSVTIKN